MPCRIVWLQVSRSTRKLFGRRYRHRSRNRGHNDVRHMRGPAADAKHGNMRRQRQYRGIRIGVEQVFEGDLPRHNHREGYATLVLAGSFTEASFSGCHRARPGDVLLHGAFDCHANYGRSRQPLQLLRLPWFDDACEGRYHVSDPDLLVRISERDPRGSLVLLRQMMVPMVDAALHWTEALALTLAQRPRQRIEDWSEENRMSPEAVSRGFRRAFGVPPGHFRLESMTRNAWRTLRAERRPLTAIAHDHGFADLAHMSRSVRAFTGAAPSAWRAFDQSGSSHPESLRA